MTLLRVYNKNGNDVASKSGEYMFSDLMKDFFGDNIRSYSSPRANITEKNEAFEIQMALPGIDKKEIKIDVDKNEMRVSHQSDNEFNDDGYARKEFDFSNFERTFYLPDSVHTEKIGAKMENGILHIHLPKKEESIDKGPKEIKIS